MPAAGGIRTAVPAQRIAREPRRRAVGLVFAQLGERGTRAAIVLTAGLAGMSGPDGRNLREAMLAAARPHLLRVLGPNCVGLLVPGIGLNASFAHLDREYRTFEIRDPATDQLVAESAHVFCRSTKSTRSSSLSGLVLPMFRPGFSR